MLLLADARRIPLADKSVHCCVTSPPYWNMRDFGIEGQIGREKNIRKWLDQLLIVFREVWRVLRDDGTLWVNMGDSYTGGTSDCDGLKLKDLIGMPWMLAFALRADGWYLRSDIIWSKPNPMPETLRDRPTKAHEYIFLLSKNNRYYYDFEAIKEEVTGEAHARGNGINHKARIPVGWDTGPGGHKRLDGNYTKERSPKDIGRDSQGLRPSDRLGRGPGWRVKQNESFSSAVAGLVDRRNKRTVWEVPTEQCPEAHFATFPEELIKPCILAGCPAGGIVLDPFIGSGTTELVARNLQCNCIGLELNPVYIEIAKRRLAQKVIEFTELRASPK